ncbi:MAG TPA: hydantoinase B/oxoprolinase family protein, partial [Geminicoccaceae bacterium]|nr:hydantoinase B/oxoprolinase family protein [Geminicoccaceae bacterium]
MALDPVTYALVSQALIAIGREMGAKLVRSAYSSIIRESRDASAALLDRHGHVVAQAELIPMHLSAMAETFAPCAARYPIGSLREGDFYITNDPYHGGQHLPDVYIFSPIFFEGALVGFAGSTAHHLDLGGGSPGLNAAAEDVYQEGLIFPPARYAYARDWLDGPLRDMVAANIRVPERTIGDFDAQFAA